ncbi:MAG: hypothetical protein U1E67_04785 [Hyphomicrobiales bacterium]
MPDFWSPLYRLIHSRSRELGLGIGAIAVRCGCNPSKGARWLDAIAHGRVGHPRAQEIVCRLPSALELPKYDVDVALAETVVLNEQRRLADDAKQDAEWRASFRPHAHFDTQSRMPTQITIFLITGGPDKYLKIKLDLKQPPLSYAGHAAKVVQETAYVPFFGKPVGFFVNYSPDCAIRFDLKGTPIEVLDRAYDPGSGSVSIGGKRISGDELTRLVR